MVYEFQNEYEYTESTTYVEIVNERDSLTEIKPEPIEFDEVEPEMVDSSIDNVNRNKPTSTITEQSDDDLIDVLEFECVSILMIFFKQE